MDLEACEIVEAQIRQLIMDAKLNDEEKVFVSKNISSFCENFRDVNFHIIAMHNAFNAK